MSDRVHVGAYFDPDLAGRFAAAATVANMNLSDALRVAAAGFAESIEDHLHDERRGSDRGAVDERAVERPDAEAA